LKNKFNPNITDYCYFARKGIYKQLEIYAGMITGNILDFGCGSKPYIDLFFGVNEYIGLDYNGQGHSHENEQIDVFYDGITIPFPDNTFDNIFTCEVLEHIPNFNSSLKELHRVLKPGGRILIVCPFIYAEHETPNDYYRYTSFGIKQICEDNGFDIIIQKKIGTSTETLAQLLLSYIVTHFTCKLGKIRNYIETPIAVIINLISIVFSFILPKGNELYLDNLIIAKKWYDQKGT